MLFYCNRLYSFIIIFTIHFVIVCMTKIIIYFPSSGKLCVFLWHYSKCFFGDLYCTDLDLQDKFRVSNKNLVSIDIEEFWYRTSTTSVAYCASTVNYVLCEY